MSKKIIISEEMARQLMILKEDKDLLSIPSFLKKQLRDNKTSLGQNPAFPPDDNNRFDAKLTLSAFKDALSEYKKLNIPLDPFDKESLVKLLDKWMRRCVKIEQPIRENLERLCAKVVRKLFIGWDELVEFKCNLVDKVDQGNRKIRLVPEDDDEYTEAEFNSIDDIDNLNEEVYKRRLLNAIIMGGALTYANDASLYLNELYDLSSELVSLYKGIMVVNQLLLFTVEESGVMEQADKRQEGCVYVNLGNDVQKTSIEAQGTIFPILLEESIKGFLELLISHGLPQNAQDASFVIKNADFALAEPWDMRLGPALWKKISLNTKEFSPCIAPLVVYQLSQLSVKPFNRNMKEILAGTVQGKELVRNLGKEINHKMDMEDLEYRLDMKRADYAPIMDGYFSVEDF